MPFNVERKAQADRIFFIHNKQQIKQMTPVKANRPDARRISAKKLRTGFLTSEG